VSGQRRRGQKYNTLGIVAVRVRPEQPKYVICVGETKGLIVDITVVAVTPGLLSIGGHGQWNLPHTARNSAPTIGTLQKVEDQPDNYGVPEAFRGYRYELKGKKAGTGSLTFTARLPASGPDSYYTHPAMSGSKTVDYEVKQCDYEVSAVHRWTIPGTLATATMPTVRVTADDSGQLSGSGTLDWLLNHRIPPCRTQDTVDPSGVDISGQVSEEGQVTLQLDYQATSGTGTYECPAPCRPRCSGSSSYSVAAPSTLSVSVPGGGGSVTRSQPIPGGFRGTAVITVTPIEREGGVASIASGALSGG
jgi:hypothetical protein